MASTAMTDRKKPGVAFWATVGLVVVLVGYPLSFGPACWLAKPKKQEFVSIEKWNFSYNPLAVPPRIYFPLCWLATHGPAPISQCFRWYAFLGGNYVGLPSDWSQF